MARAVPALVRRTVSTPILLIAGLAVIALLTLQFGSGLFVRTVVEMFLRVIVVVGLYVFVGNSGVISFGHIGFMCLGAYATAWLTIKPAMKKISLRGLPEFLAQAELHYLLSLAIATVFVGAIAYVFARILMRLNGIAASIATFAMLAIINTVYSNWDAMTAATSSVIGIPVKTGIWTSLIGAGIAIIVAWAHQISRSGLALRAGRDEPIAAAASGVDIVRERVVAFVVSAMIVGAGGVLYAHFLGVLTVDAFYLNMTFVTLSMLVVGGMGSLSGAVVGVVALSSLIQILRWLEKGVPLGDLTVQIPNGLQEIALGVIMIIILMFRPTGLTRSREISWRRAPSPPPA